MDLLTGNTELMIAGNEPWRILMMALAIAIAFIAGKVLRLLLLRTAPRLKNRGQVLLSVLLMSASRGVTFLIMAFGLSAALSFLILPEGVDSLAFTMIEVLVIIAFGHLVFRMVDVVDVWLERFAGSEDHTQIDDMLIPIVGKTLRVTVVILVVLQTAQALSDKPITSILAGIGIGGLALGLAAQDTIRNFFGSLMIFADKPFDVGDLINLNDTLGVVEEVGVRTTKLNTLDGHLLTVPNGQLANETIHNIGKRPFIRRVFSITITYDTPQGKVHRALDLLREILDNHEGMDESRPPRVFFDEFNADSLNLICFYWYHPPDYWSYMAFTEKINLEIFRRFNEEGIDFAFPTQTIHLAGDGNRPLDIGVRKTENGTDGADTE